MKKSIRLPNTLHGLLRVALADLKKTMADPRYTISMGTWYNGTSTRPDHDGERKCAVCLAGSVIAQRADASRTAYITPGNFSDSTCAKLTALNELRLGSVNAALYTLLGAAKYDANPIKSSAAVAITKELDIEARAKGDVTCPTRRICYYVDDPKRFIAEMTALQLKLPKANI